MWIMNFKDFNAPSNVLYAECKVLKLEDIIKVNNCLFVHDFINGLLPKCFEDYFLKIDLMYTNYETRGSSLGALFVPTVNIATYGINSIIYKSIQCWNHITSLYKTNLSKLSRRTFKHQLVTTYTAEMLST